jgi:hypothetical protein
MKKRKVSRDGGEIHFTRAEYKCLRAHRQGIQQEPRHPSSAAHAAVRTLTEILEHPVKSLMCGSVERQDQLAPSDMLPVKAQFDNTRQD